MKLVVILFFAFTVVALSSEATDCVLDPASDTRRQTDLNLQRMVADAIPSVRTRIKEKIQSARDDGKYQATIFVEHKRLEYGDYVALTQWVRDAGYGASLRKCKGGDVGDGYCEKIYTVYADEAMYISWEHPPQERA